MAIFMVRHASAVSRASWGGDDDERPLDERGVREAAAIRERLAGRAVARVLSSPSARCTQTVEGLATDRGLDVIECLPLYEGGDPRDALSTLLDQASGIGGDLVACSHGDLIPKMVRALIADGMLVHSSTPCEKGSVWELRLDHGAVVEGTYYGPQTSG